MPALTVIIPAYNVGEFIEVCLDSVANQTFHDMEIIIIDDASEDNTKEKIYGYCKKYTNMHIIENESNIGVGRSRNHGIEIANGEYIGFIDGDDWVDLNYYTILMSVAVSTSSDIVMASITNEFGNHLSSTTRYAYNEGFTVDGKTGLRLLTKSENMGALITPIMNNKVYKRKYLINNKISCSDNRSWQDDYFSFFAILYGNKITFAPNTTYHYKQRTSSTTHEATDSKSKIDNCLSVLSKIKNRLKDDGIYSLYKHEYQSFVERCISSLLSMIQKKSTDQNSDILCYLFSEIMHTYNIDDIIKYLDNERIYRFFNL